MNQDSAERSRVLGNKPQAEGSVTDMTSTIAKTCDLEKIYREHYARFVRLAYTFIGRRDLAEEAVQDAFIQANRHWHRANDYDDPVGWIRRIVLNRSCDTTRRRSSERNALAKVISITRFTSIPQAVDPDEQLWAAVRSLPPQQAALIALVYVEQLDVYEAAAALDLSESTARTQLTRAKAKLAATIRSSDAFEYEHMTTVEKDSK
jgi:RNA polymerase sigma-70 factor, ECF subfamily